MFPLTWFTGLFFSCAYRFKVYYYEKNVNCDGKTKVGEGEILYIAPRHPGKRVKTSPYVTWEQALRDIDEDLEAGRGALDPSYHQKRPID